jgi:hypothetical protein
MLGVRAGDVDREDGDVVAAGVGDDDPHRLFTLNCRVS